MSAQATAPKSMGAVPQGAGKGRRPGVVVSLRGVQVRYPGTDTPVLSNVHFELYEGESVLFLGPSGSGKSTLALLIAGLVPGAVEAEVSGQVWRHPRLSEPGGIGMVFQDPETQLCMLEVGDELAFGLENLRVPRDQMRERVRAALRERGLPLSLSQPHQHFSGGMKQKLAMACTRVMRPLVMICDEPTANLDPLASRQVFIELARVRQQGQTLLVIEHRFDPLLPFMDRVVLLDHTGRIHRSGPTRQVVAEEWEWMKQVGIVPPWKSPPDADARAASGPAAPFRAHAVRDASGVSPLAARSIDQPPLDGQASDERPRAQEPAAVSISGGRLAYARHVVWDDVNFTIPSGSFTAIVGPNGAGKSSLLQAMMGMVRLDAGELSLLGRPLPAWSRRELVEAAAYCFQNPEFQFIFERVADELANRAVGEDIPEAVRALLAEFGLAGTERKSPFSLSQGQKRRLSVATMLRQPHRLYLLDEPTFGQDAATQAALLRRLRELNQQGATIVITTHDMDLVRTWATQVVVLAEGGVLFCGPPKGLFARPDIMARAHLVDDLRPLAEISPQEEDTGPSASGDPSTHDTVAQGARTPSLLGGGRADKLVRDAAGCPAQEPDARSGRRKPLAARINPAVQLLTCVVSVCIAMAVRSIPQGLGLFAFVLALMMGLAWLSPSQIVKRMSPFLAFYIVYVWTQTAYARVAPGTPTFQILWYHLSWPGFLSGLVLALRMLSAVGLGVYVLSSVDVTETMAAFCQNLRVPPKFAYGLLAGIRYLPLFQDEWTRLRKARQLRGRDAKVGFLRPAVYALPLLSQAVRMAERAALAMEARGFQGDAAATAGGRTYFRQVSLTWRDGAYAVGLNLAIVALLWLLRP
ncbi:ATP-binding cassette domain-containing protein [Alicyclobacillus kakegawensis]|uniref:ATP-binding cassette domain-containing protein n=1 Tax=Alicyclobacillus kakegawensis TaxID=392012 RepID=UPI00082C9081|nr:ATP-binding cassette domain-containing protein [Alicyclobacillus kakegawensis]